MRDPFFFVAVNTAKRGVNPRVCRTPDPAGGITRRYTAALERSARRAPEQYFWVHRHRRAAPGTKRRRRRAAA